MKIKHIEISGMHNIKGTKSFDIENQNIYFYGKNGVGKSTILQAIQLALLGYIPGTNKNKESIFQHANSNIMSVSIKFDDNGEEHSISRTWVKSKSSIQCVVDSDISIEDITRDVELPIFNYSDFVDLTPNKLKDWFIEFLPSANVSTYWINVLNTEEYKKHEETLGMEMINEAASQINSFGLTGVDEIRKANDYFKECLSFKKKELERQQNTIQTMVIYNDVDDSMSIDEIEAELASLNEKRTLLNAYKINFEKNKNVMQELSRYEGFSAESYELDERYVENIKKFEELKKEIESTNEVITVLNSKFKELTSEKYKLKEDIIFAETSKQSNHIEDDLCPITGERCSHIAKLKDSIDEFEAEQTKKINDLKSSYSEVESKISSCEKELHEYEGKLRQISIDKNQISSLIQSLKDNYERKSFLLSQKFDVPENFNPDEILDIQSRIAKLESLKSKLYANKKYNEMIDVLTADKFKTEFEIIVYKDWIKLTDVNGLQTECVSSVFAELANEMNTSLASLFNEDVTCEFHIESKANSFSFGVRRKDSYIPYNQLSSGEKCMYTLALLSSLVTKSASQINLVIVDDLLDHLDSDRITNLFNALTAVTDVQYILAGVTSCNLPFAVEVKEN